MLLLILIMEVPHESPAEGRQRPLCNAVRQARARFLLVLGLQQVYPMRGTRHLVRASLTFENTSLHAHLKIIPARYELGEG